MYVCIPCIYGSIAEIQRVLGLEESTHHHLLEPGDGRQLAKSNNSSELAHVWTTASKLEEAGAVDGLWREREMWARVCRHYMVIIRTNPTHTLLTTHTHSQHNRTQLTQVSGPTWQHNEIKCILHFLNFTMFHIHIHSHTNHCVTPALPYSMQHNIITAIHAIPVFPGLLYYTLDISKATACNSN